MPWRSRVPLFVSVLWLLSVTAPVAEMSRQDRNSRGQVRVSPRVTAQGEIDGVVIRIEYGSPYKRGRLIWGGLRPWGQWWMPGADEATTITTSGPLMVGTIAVPPGVHSIYTIPDPDTFVFVINARTGQFHTQYSPSQDLGRTAMTLRPLSTPVEQLTFGIVPGPGGHGVLTLAWDDREYSVSVSGHSR